MAIPVVYPGIDGSYDSDRIWTRAIVERALVQDLPEFLDQVEPSGGLEHWNELEPWMSPVPEHRVHCSVLGQWLHDQVYLSLGDKYLQTIQEFQLGSDVIGFGRLNQHLAFPENQRSTSPDMAVAQVIGSEVRSVSIVRSGWPDRLTIARANSPSADNLVIQARSTRRAGAVREWTSLSILALSSAVSSRTCNAFAASLAPTAVGFIRNNALRCATN